ncbi:MAG: hypothetical protein IPJ32_04000 [Sphingobacteriaceae bacterium]|nr:hypothetical protein [Sphingobacteriaceae bacterium]
MAKIFVLVFISYIYLYRSFHSFTNPYVVGDGFEYILMTEAYQNHFSPDVTLDDINSFKEKFSKAHSWQDFYKKGYVESLIADFKKSKGEFKETKQMQY